MNYIGKNYKEVEKELEDAKIKFRVTREDNEKFAFLTDHNLSRLSFEVEKGIIVSQKFG